jgi:hypothetical protein
MNYVGNQKEWITPELMEILKNRQGDRVPIWDPERGHGHPLLEQITEQGLAWFGECMPEQYFHIFNARSEDLKDYNFVLPKLPMIGKNVFWWFVRLNPGELQLMHYDMHVLGVFHEDNKFSKVTGVMDIKNVTRYTMFLQDWHPGHVFVYKDKTVANYQAGDIFEWSDPELLHGVANLSFLPRYTLQITSHD